MSELITAFAFVMVIEGALYAVIPSKMQDMMRQMLDLSENNLRVGGLSFLTIGFLVIWYMKS